MDLFSKMSIATFCPVLVLYPYFAYLEARSDPPPPPEGVEGEGLAYCFGAFCSRKATQGYADI